MVQVQKYGMVYYSQEKGKENKKETFPNKKEN